MDKVTIPDLNGTNYFIWELKMKAALSLKRLDSLIINEKPGDLSRKDEIEWQTKNLDAISYIKLSLADEEELQFSRRKTMRKCCGIKLERLSSAEHLIPSATLRRFINSKASRRSCIIMPPKRRAIGRSTPQARKRRALRTSE
ncbi:retrovirus-related Pol polyprotein from transposon TNT 1-94 [Trichonephila clavipes]|nr:retrovirus-related Pol polyprotein from transposon TNT 1-94 [Trichonephila clavipes]